MNNYIVYIVYNDGTTKEHYASSEHVARLKAIYIKLGTENMRIRAVFVLDEYNNLLWKA